MIPFFYKDKFKKIDGASRDPSFPEMQYGTLKRITYPTGGYTEFEFEANKAYTHYTKYNYLTPAVITQTLGLGQANKTYWASNPQTLTGVGIKITLELVTTNSTTNAAGILSIYK